MAVFRVTIDQIRAAPHMRLLRRGGVVYREVDDTDPGSECSFYDSWHLEHNGIVMRAMRLDEQAVREVQCAECVRRFGPCNVVRCFFKEAH